MARSIAALAVSLLVFFEKGRACNVCGTGLGLMAVYRQRFDGFSYPHLPFSSTLTHDDGSSAWLSGNHFPLHCFNVGVAAKGRLTVPLTYII